MVLHVRGLDEDTLARKIYEEQRANSWPGLAKETSVLCTKLKVEDCNTTRLSKAEYRKLFVEACNKYHEEKLRKDGGNMTKCDRIMKDEYGQKEYFKKANIFEARQMFRTRVGLNDFAGNYKKSLKFQPTNWLCRCLSNIENEAHLKEGLCHVYRDIRDKYDTLEDDENLVKYFSEVIARRNALDEDRGGAASATDALLAGDSPASQSGGLVSAD